MDVSNSSKAQKAGAYFRQGCNCAQSVFAAFAEEAGMDEQTALRHASAFGGGMGGLREICGAISGMNMVLGIINGYDSPEDQEGKKLLYAQVQQLAKSFTDEYGTLICRDLLKRSHIEAQPVPSARDEEYYRKRPCARYVECCAALLEEALKKES